MALLVFECDPKMLRVEERIYPDADASFIYEHLKYYCSKFDPLPAATVALREGQLLVVQGQKYVRIAVELGRKMIRAIMTDANTEEIQRLVRTDGINVLDWQALRREEEQTSVLDAVHVFFFESGLSEHQKQLFEEKIAGFFHRLQSVLLQGKAIKVSNVVYSHDDRSAEFVATTPAGDPRWFGDFHASCLNFSRSVARMASYQGRRFVS